LVRPPKPPATIPRNGHSKRMDISSEPNG
jgi:hypothetical protein